MNHAQLLSNLILMQSLINNGCLPALERMLADWIGEIELRELRLAQEQQQDWGEAA